MKLEVLNLNTVKCPNCGSENLSTNIRCENCGAQLIMEEQASNTQFDPSEDTNINSFMEISSGIGATIGGAIFSGFSSMLVFRGADNITKIIGIPFFICGLAALFYGIILIIKGIYTKKNNNDYVNGKLNKDKVEKSEKNFEKIENFVNHIYVFGFLLFWFGFLIVFDSIAIKSWSDGGNLMFFFSLIFWLAGIYILIKNRKN